ncbi:MAG TPA: SPOR domain-containing protein [Proteobacteria bacterium]|nr:sporulation related domain protein [bacterium BMS3Abin14]HDL52460.1 SPOR domain-containing protein [Pseudomonadota bacterium]
MARVKKTTQPRDLVRFSPKQFSAAVAFVVLLISAAFLTGYLLGGKSAKKNIRDPVASRIGHDAGNGEDNLKAGNSRSKAKNATTITFYAALTRKEGNRRKIPQAGAKEKHVPRPVQASAQVGKPGEPLGGTVIQVGSYRDRGAAEQFLKGLADSGYRGAVVRADLGPRGVWYRVRLGPYGSIMDARKALSTLKTKKAIRGFLVKPGA